MSETLARMPVTIAPSDLPAPHDPDLPYTISMVCTGNICRSAMAEVVLIDRLAAAGVPACGPAGVVVTSAGVSDEEHGNPIDRRARRLLAERGYGSGDDAAARAAAVAVSGHAAHRIGDAELAGADLVLAMTSAHRRELLRRAERLGVDADRIRMFRELDPVAGDERHWAAVGARTRHGLDVPDPWYGTMEDFVETLDVVERVCDALAPALAELSAQRRR
ncbi:MAG: protein-tyrosine-phosphatase [Actinomyces sp.]|nr:MAG: protein-tyrosine-phosphatase [Actinomyces sp.]